MHLLSVPKCNSVYDDDKQLLLIRGYNVLYRSAYDGGDVQISKIAGGMRVNIGSSMEFDLHELTASDRRSELQQLLVGMGRLIEALQNNLTGNRVLVKFLV